MVMLQSDVKKQNRYFSAGMVGLCLTGLAVNLILSLLSVILNLPLYLDCIGSILVAALCGGLPAVCVAFLSNLINSMNNPLNLYYGIPAILIAVLAAVFARKKMLDNWKGWLLSSFCFALVGCATSSVIGWYTFGEQINGIAAPLAFRISDRGISPFFAQLLAEGITELQDKLLSGAVVCLILRFYPKKLYGKFYYSYRYEHGRPQAEAEEENLRPVYGHSINRRMTGILTVSVVTVGIFTLTMGSFYYQKLLQSNCRYNAQNVSARAAMCVNGDQAAAQLSEGRLAEGYTETENKLTELYMNGMDIRYLYVYVIKQDGCYVLFDVDVPGETGAEPGTRVKNDPDIYGRLEEFLSGGEVEPGYGNGAYGTLMSAYTPICDSTGATVAYACADIDLSIYIQRMLSYIIQFATFVFAVILVTLILIIWYVKRHISEPIRMIVEQTRALDSVSPENWLSSREWADRVPLRTDDELEDLYVTVTRAEENVSVNVRKRMETEQKLLQTRELETVNQELEVMIRKADEANRAKTDFLSRMSHDMRTPMNAIIGLSALTLDDAENPDAVRENMAKIRSSSDFLLGLVNDILDLAKIEDGSVVLKPEPYTYEEFLMNMKTMFQAQCDAKEIKLSIEEPKSNPMVRVDKLRINQIFFNIFSNAVKYTPVGGCIEYRIERRTEHDMAEGKQLSVDFLIRDTGIGMSREYQQHLFEPFMQENSDVTPELQGSGLGLSITKQLVDLMGGTIQIESAKGKGTAVRIHMEMECLAANVTGKKKTIAEYSDDAVLAGKYVLLAEDHPLNAQIARKLLEKKQMIVAHAENGKRAVEMFEASVPGSIDVILMDIRMPQLSGLDAARAIRVLERSDARTVPIIAMSANAYPEDVQKSLDAGMNGHLAKPVDPNVLYRTLGEYLK